MEKKNEITEVEPKISLNNNQHKVNLLSMEREFVERQVGELIYSVIQRLQREEPEKYQALLNSLEVDN